MKINYRFRPLSRDDRALITMVLLDELELQTWFAVTYNKMTNEEVLLTLQ